VRIACPAVVEPVETPKGEDVRIACPAVVEPVETPQGEVHEFAYFQICIFPNLSDSLPCGG
jgi:hypothetical protein